MLERWPKPRGTRRKRPVRTVVFIIFSILVLLFTAGIAIIDQRLLPIVIEVTHLHSVNRVNVALDQALAQVIEEYNLDTKDFYIKTEDEDGRIYSLSVNTLLANKVCSSLSVSVSQRLAAEGPVDVEIPIGAILGVSALANSGPSYKVTILPVGDAVVDYSSSFISAGINQINFQVWLDVESTVKIVNPFQPKDIKVTRKVALVNTVFAGEIPEMYLNPAGDRTNSQ